MKRLFFSAAWVCSISMTGFAQERAIGGSFNAPTVNGTAEITYPVLGDIVFDGSGSAFYGWDGSSWINLGATGTPAGPSTSGIVTHGPAGQNFGGPKTFDDNVSVSGTLTPAGGIVGQTSGTTIGSGFVGQKIEASVSTTNHAASGTFKNVTSVTLSAGVWMIYGVVTTNKSGATMNDALEACIATATASSTGSTEGIDYSYAPTSQTVTGIHLVKYVNISSSTNYYLNTRVTYGGVGTPTYTGSLRAIRIQ